MGNDQKTENKLVEMKFSFENTLKNAHTRTLTYVHRT